ncbi:TauD/TfdA family dioxygenase [soil metagenome]
MNVIPTGRHLGARVEGVDLSRPFDDALRDKVIGLLGEHGVLCFPKQKLDPEQQKAFSANFGDLEINVAGQLWQEPGHPEVMILSNIVRDGKPIGIGDAGQGWHTDMSYSSVIAFANVLYGIQIPHRDGKPLGGTSFCDMQAAYNELPEDLKQRLDGMTALHDFSKFYDMMRFEKNSPRPALTPAQKAAKPPVSHPIVMKHPITGRKVLYANPGYAVRINEMSQQESDEVLAFLFEHQTQQRFVYTFEWSEGDLLIWDDIRTIHQALSDYRPDEPRLIKRCQVMASRFMQPA